MKAQNDENESQWGKAQVKALEIIDQLSPEDRIQVLVSERHPYRYRWLDKQKAKEYVQHLRTSGSMLSLREAYAKMQELESPKNTSREYVFISDFQSNTLDKSPIKGSEDVALIPIRTEKLKNQYFDSLRLSRGRGKEQQYALKYRLRNNQNTRAKSDVQFYLNGQLKGSQAYGADSLSLANIDFSSQKNGWNQIMLVSTQPDALMADDTARISIFLSPKQQVLICQQKGISPALQVVFTPESQIVLRSTDLSRLSSFEPSEYNMLILDHIQTVDSKSLLLLSEFLERGVSVVFIPSEDMDLGSINSMLSQLAGVRYSSLEKQELTVAKLNAGHSLWQEVFTGLPRDLQLPEVKEYYPIHTTNPSYLENIMEFSNGSPYIISRKYANAYFMTLSSPILRQSSNLAYGPYFLPLLYSLSASKSLSTAHTYQQEQAIKIPLIEGAVKDQILVLTNKDQKVLGNINYVKSKPELVLPPGVLGTGFWDLENRAGDALNQQISVNFSESESQIDPAGEDALRAQFENDIEIWEDDAQIVSSIAGGNSFSFWKLILIFAAAFLLVESGLLNKKKA